MRLNQELHRIIAICAALAILVFGITAWWEVLRVHHLEVESHGETTALRLSRACAVAIAGPNPVEDLTYVLSSSRVDEESPKRRLVSATVYDAEGEALARVGATSRELPPEEDRFLQQVLELARSDSDQVLSQRGEDDDRYSQAGEDIYQFGTPIYDHAGNVLGVLTVALLRAPVAFTMVRSVTQMVLVAALLVGALWFLFFKLLDDRILSPILQLSRGIERVRTGDLTGKVEIVRDDEIGTLVGSFNELIGVLVERDSLQARLEEANRLAEAHTRLHEAHRQLKQAQENLILNEKHASLGRLVHGLNHELNNPLSAAQNMIPPLETALESLRQHLLAEVLSNSSDSLEESGEAESPADAVEADAAEPNTAEADAAEADAAEADAAEAGADEADADEADAAEAGSVEAGADPKPTEVSEEPSAAGLDPTIQDDLADVESAVAVIERSVRRAINIVRDLGQFSKLGSVDLETIELQALVDEAEQTCRQELGSRFQIEVATDIAKGEDDQPLNLKAFPGLISQVFVNLLTNSAQAQEEGGKGKVKVTAALVGDGRVRIDVEDNGPGIAKEHLHKVFEPFFTTKEQGRGTGLGLAICLGIVHKHGGTIEARKRRRGAHIVIELPLQPVVDQGDPWASSPLLASNPSVA